MPKEEFKTIDFLVRSQIYGHGKSRVFTRKHFRDLGSTAAIDSCLGRLKASGTIRQLARGLYDYLVNDPVLGSVARCGRLRAVRGGDRARCPLR